MEPPEDHTGERTTGEGSVGEATDLSDIEATSAARSVVDRFRDEDVTFQAASIAYYAIASFLPLLIVSMAVLSLVGASDALVEFLRGSASASIADVVDTALEGTQGRGGAGVVGFLVALWGATRIFRGISKAFGNLYDTPVEEGLVDQLGEALVTLALLLFAFAVVSMASAGTALVPEAVPFAGVLFSVVGFVLLVLGLLPFYYVLPPRSVTLGHALPGAIVAAVGWTILQAGFSIYAANAGTYQAYGFLGAVLLFVVFLYFAAVVLLTGATVNATLDRGA